MVLQLQCESRTAGVWGRAAEDYGLQVREKTREELVPVAGTESGLYLVEYIYVRVYIYIYIVQIDTYIYIYMYMSEVVSCSCESNRKAAVT